MNMHESSTLSEAMASSTRAPARTSALGLALIRLTAWLKDCGDHLRRCGGLRRAIAPFRYAP